MNKTERLILFNQYEILKELKQDDKDYYQKCQDIVANGFESEYNTLTEYFSEVSAEISNEVKNILQMFRDLGDSFEKLKDKQGIDEYYVRFRGFDGNEEIDHFVFAKWFVTEERYSESLRTDMSSHMNVLNQYRRMYEKYRKILDKKENTFYCSNLTADEIKEIIS